MLGKSLPAGWRWTTLGEVAQPGVRAIVSGPFGSNIGSRFFVDAGVPVIRGNNLTTDMRRFIDDDFVFITEEKADELGSCEAVGDDIVFTAAGSLGQVGLIPCEANYQRYIISNKQLRARVDRAAVDPLFAFYWFASREMVEYIQQRNTGSSVPLINLGVLRSLPLPLPPLAEQRAIAHILGALDDKIELNQRMNATLEAMARALFRSWFVDFDPVWAKLDGRAPFGLDLDIAALFPEQLEDSTLGPIPKGWQIGSIGESFNLTMGQSPPGDTYNEEGHGTPFYQGRTDFGFRFPARRVYCSAPTRYAKAGDTLVSVRAPVGDTNTANEQCCIGRGVAAVRHKSGAKSFTFYTLANLYSDFARFEAEGTIFGSINKDSFKKLRFLIPPTELIAAFEQRATPLDDHILNIHFESLLAAG